MTISAPYSDETLATMRRLYVDEGLSSSVIAKRMNLISRSVVIGQSHRRGWKRPVTVSKQNVARGGKVGVAKQKASRPVPPQAPRPFKLAPPVPCADPISFTERRMTTQCAWLVNDGEPWLCCGAPIERGSYCGPHSALASSPPRSGLMKLAGLR